VKKSEMIMMAAEGLTIGNPFICIHLKSIDEAGTFDIRRDVRALIKGCLVFETYMRIETELIFDVYDPKTAKYFIFARRKLCEHLRDRYLAEGD
jgi:hypothetical protein